MNITCRNHVCFCPSGDPDSPIANLSAEAPDNPAFFSDPVPPFRPPLGWWRAQACNGAWCTSFISEIEALRCAARMATECLTGDGLPGCDSVCPPNDGGACTDPNCGPVTGNGFTNSAKFYSVATTCKVQCPNGDFFFHTVAANTIVSLVSQEDADARAEALCWKEIKLLKLCFGFGLTPACVGSLYTHLFTASGGKPPYTFSLNYATAPNGFTLDPATGEFTGTPTTAGLYNLEMAVTDANTPPTTIQKTFAFYVAEITTTTLPDAETSVAYSTTLAENGAPAGTTWQLAAGSLPPGLTLNSITGEISGTPTTTGTYAFRIALVLA